LVYLVVPELDWSFDFDSYTHPYRRFIVEALVNWSLVRCRLKLVIIHVR